MNYFKKSSLPDKKCRFIKSLNCAFSKTKIEKNYIFKLFHLIIIISDSFAFFARFKFANSVEQKKSYKIHNDK